MTNSKVGSDKKMSISLDDAIERGLWWYGWWESNPLTEDYHSDVFQQQLQEWQHTDVENGWLACHYSSYAKKGLNKKKNPNISDSVQQQVNNAIAAKKSVSWDPLQLSLREWLYLLIEEEKYWHDEIKGFPALPIGEDIERASQECTIGNPHMKPEFIIELFRLYCEKWQYNTKLSNKTLLIFERAFSDNYSWYMLVQKKRLQGFTHFRVVLADKTIRKLKPEHVVYQLRFSDDNFNRFCFEPFYAAQFISRWKVEVHYRYLYVERYIDWLKPRLLKHIEKPTA